MAHNEELTIRVRKTLAHLPNLQEKKMFRGIAFLLNEKLLVSTGNDELMLRIDPALHDGLLQERGTRSMVMKGKELKGWIYVKEENLKAPSSFDRWISLATDFNGRAKASKKKK